MSASELSAPPLPAGDYVSPGLAIVRPDAGFPHMKPHDPRDHPWPYIRREVRHNWYADERFPLMGFLSRDEAAILHNTALQFKGRRALEIGCWRGWSTCHLALGGVVLDVLDPILADPETRVEVENALTGCGCTEVALTPAASPAGVLELGAAGRRWSLFFIDGDHEAPAPELDAEICCRFAEDDCAFVFHDLASPLVADGLRYLAARGFHVMVYQTMQIMAIAWRGRYTPLAHIPDPAVPWQLPHHLVGLPVAGAQFASFTMPLRQTILDQAAELQRLNGEMDRMRTLADSHADLAKQYRQAVERMNAHPVQRTLSALKRLLGR